MSLQDDCTLDCIANDNNISPSTVNRYLDQSRAIASLIKQELPINMALGEFRELINSYILFVLTMMAIIRFKRSYRIVINVRLKTIF